MTKSTISGEEKAWDMLAMSRPEEVCAAATVSYDKASMKYRLISFGTDFVVSVTDKRISSAAPGSEALLAKLGYFFRYSVLWYLVSAKNIDCTGRLVRLEQIKGGDIFAKGTHMLPLDVVARKYSKDKDGFIRKGMNLGGERVKFGDASVRLYPLPRIPVTLTLWLEDEEFPARTDLLFDSTCEFHLATDILWSVAMISVLIME